MLARVRPAALTLASAAVLAATLHASPAQAQTDVHDDAQHDVVGLGEDLAFLPVPDRTDPDVRRLVVRHSPAAVTIRLRVVDLDPAVEHVVAGRLRTPDGDADFEWLDRPGRPAQGRLVRADGTRCEAASARFDVAADRVRVRVPRSCLDRPAWVRVGAGLGSFTVLDEDVYLDDALSSTVRPDFVLGPRLRAS